MRLTASLSLPRRPSTLAHARHVLDTMLSLTETSDDRRADLGVLVTEACANAVQHSRPDSTVDLDIVIDTARCVIDVGNSSDTVPRGAVTAGPPDPLAVRGRGLPLIAALADRATFTPAGPGRVLLRMISELT